MVVFSFSSLGLAKFRDGVLLRARGQNAVYLIKNGRKSHVMNPLVFKTCGFKLSAVKVVSIADINSIRLGPPLTHCRISLPNYTFIKSPKRNHIYLYRSGKKYYVRHALDAKACGYGWRTARVLPQAFLDSIRSGDSGQLCRIRANWLIKSYKNPKIYAVIGGKRRHIVNPAVLRTCFKGHKVKSFVNQRILQRFPSGLPFTNCFREGALLKGSGPKVYVFMHGKKRHITNPAVFKACGYQWSQVRTYPNAVVGVTPTGTPLNSCKLKDGTLILNESRFGIYIIRNGKKHHVINAKKACRGKWGQALKFPVEFIKSIPRGSYISHCY
tara:strand:- start:2005 stop:2985 length:981 start_codon:yes stop_codon:yes gene_type:complete